MKTDAEADGAAFFCCERPDSIDLFARLIKRLTKAQVYVGMACRDFQGRIRRAAKIDRRMRPCDRAEQERRIIDVYVLTMEGHLVAAENAAPDLEKLIGEIIAFVMLEIDAITRHLVRIRATYRIDPNTAFRKPIERSGHAGRNRRRDSAGTKSHEKLHASRSGGERRGCDPGIFAASPNRNKRAGIPERVYRLRNSG